MIDWNKLNKINVRELTDAQTKHLVVKALIVQRLLIKYRNKNWIRIYTEFPVTEGKIADVYFENISNQECYCYEIQSNVSKQWLEETKRIYATWQPYLVTTADWILIDLNNLSDNIQILKGELDKLII
jgi:hypothetical protein